MKQLKGLYMPGKLVRVSTGTAITLGLTSGFIEAKPTTAYLLLYHEGRCLANCLFCPQAKSSRASLKWLSRVSWPPHPIEKVVKAIGEAYRLGLIKRVCIQAVNYPNFFEDLTEIASSILGETSIPMSVCCQPLTVNQLKALKDLGVERVCIPLDAATKELFDKVKGEKTGSPYRWDKHLKTLKEAVKVFGQRRVSTHFIVGLGETEKDVVLAIWKVYRMGVYPALFAFTPVRGTSLESKSPPPLASYRRIQVARYLLVEGFLKPEDIEFGVDGRIISFNIPAPKLLETLRMGKPFMTSGCPSCNRPFYNENPRGPLYNYPRPLTREEAEVEASIVLKTTRVRWPSWHDKPLEPT